MADIITRLVMKSDAFDANLKRAKGSVNSFQNDISNMAKTAGAGVLKFAGTLGIAVGASEAFMKTIRGSQTTSDEFDAQMRTCQTSVNEFFTSLSTGDFTYFLGGLDSIISKSRDAYAALDQLGNARISYDYFREDFNAVMAEARSVAMDSTASKEQREAALREWTKALEDKKNKAESVGSDALTALKTVLVEGNRLNSDDVTLEDFAKVLSYDVAGSNRNALKSEMVNKYNTYKIKYAELERRKKSGGLADWAFPESKGAKDRASLNDFIASKQAELNKEYKDAILFQQAIVKWKDEELIKAVQLGKEYKQINQELANDKKTFDRVRDRVNKPQKEPEDKDKKPLKDTLAWYDAEISRLNKELMSATTMQARAATQTTINELEKKKVNIKIVVKKIVFEEEHGKEKEGQPPINRPGNQFGLNHKSPDFKLPKFESPIKKDDVKLNEEYAESLGLIGSVMGNLSGVTNDSARAYLQWGANVLSSISMAIPLIAKLTTAKTAEAAAEAASSAAKVPFVGWMAAAGAALSVVAAMASIPKFAKGGIVPGISFAGDKVPAMLNSGEMILNGSQQANLFKILNSKLYAGLDVGRPNITPSVGHLAGLISPSSNDQKVEVTGNFKVRGQDLELVLDNRSRIKNKIR